MKLTSANITTLSLTTLTLLSGAILSSSLVSADNDSVVDEINITVPISCTLSGTGQNSHNAEINNGQYNSAIGETTIKAFCNDNEGFAIYAIGYTNSEEGNDVLTNSTLGSTYDIVTGTAISGNTSNWAMKLSTISSPAPTYPIIIAGASEDTLKEQGDPDYTSFQEVPDDYTKVAYRTSNTDIGTNAEGSTLKTTYQAYISSTQPAGTYTGQVKYTLVHPHDAAAPQKPTSIEDALAAAGKTKHNGYYKIQDINSTICEATDIIEVNGMTEVIDVRDDTVYRITKLKDGKCWMLNNLALDPTDSSAAANMSEQNTNAPAAAITNYLNGGGGTTGWSDAAVSVSSSNSYTVPYIDNQYKDTLMPSYGPGATDGYAKFGIKYNFCAATVGTFCYEAWQGVNIPDTNIDAPYDVCPANWRLPTFTSDYVDGDYQLLRAQYPTYNDATNPVSIQYNLSITFFSTDSSLPSSYFSTLWSSTHSAKYDNIGLLQAGTNYLFFDFNNDETSPRNYKFNIRCLVAD